MRRPGSFLAPLVFLSAIVCTLSARADLPAAARLAGRVTDTAGRPIAGAPVSAWADGARELRDPAMVDTQTGEDGRFALGVPFAGVRYTVWARRAGYSGETVRALAGDGKDLAISLKPQPRRTLTGYVGDETTGAPVQGARVVLTGEYGFQTDVETNEAGRFEMAELPEALGQAVIVVRADGRVSPFRMFRNSERSAKA